MIRHNIYNWLTKGLNTSSGIKDWFGAKSKDTELISGFYASAIQKRADAFKSVPNYLVRNGEKVNDSQFQWILDEPNPATMQTWTDIKEVACLSLDHYGKAFLWFQPITNQLSNIWVLPTPQVELVLDKQNGLVGFRYKHNDKELILPKNEVVYIKHNYIDTAENFGIGGYAKYRKAVQSSIEVEFNSNNYLNDLLTNGGVPPMVAKTDNKIGEKQWQGIKDVFGQLFSKNPPKVMFGEEGLTFTPLDIKDLSNLIPNGSITNDAMFKILIALGIPPSIMTGEFANRDTAKTNWANFLTYTIEPIVQKFESAINVYLHSKDSSISMTHDPYIFQDEALDLQTTQMLITSGAITVDEARIKYGYEPIPKSIEGTSETVLNGINSLSPLVSTKVLEAMSQDEIRALVGLKPKGNEVVETPAEQQQDTTSQDVTKILKSIELNDKEYRETLFKKLDSSTQEYSEKQEKHIKRLIADIQREVTK